MEDSGALKVLSVVGAGRSGTTVLASVLAEYDGFASAGELRWLWQRGLREGRPCACGKTPDDCDVWSEVAVRSLGTPGPTRTAKVERIVKAQRELLRMDNRIRAIRSVGNPGDSASAQLQTVRDASEAACRAFAAVSDARVVIDTSKRALDAAMLTSHDDIEQYVLHVVRDPRAVVHSWRNAKSFSVDGETHTMGTRRLGGTVRRWWWSSLAAEMLQRQVPASRWLRIRYEDFAQRPEAVIGEVLTLLGEAPDRSPFQDGHTVMLHPNHMVAGNPSRFSLGPVPIRTDDRWRAQMPPREQRAIAFATRPLMSRYGYGR
jgi:Sulfotransferase family